MLNRTFRVTTAAALGAAWAATPAHAGTIAATLDSVTGKALTVKLGATQYSGLVGMLNWTGVESNPPGLVGAFSTFCIDMTQIVRPGVTYEYETGGLETAGVRPDAAQRISGLWGEQLPALSAPSEMAAFQLVIWELLYETSGVYGLSSGHLSLKNATLGTNAAITSFADSLLADLSTMGAGTAGTRLEAMTNPGWQDQAWAIPAERDGGRAPAPVPLPPGMWAGLVLLGGVAMKRHGERRRRG